MTQEDKQLLLKDLCARLPYGMKYIFGNDDCDYAMDMISLIVVDDAFPFEYIKPYLRPMSSMTEEEQRTLDSMCNGVEMVSRLSGLKMFNKAFDWLNEHHLDYRGLIDKGLALEAPKDMYKTK